MKTKTKLWLVDFIAGLVRYAIACATVQLLGGPTWAAVGFGLIAAWCAW